MARIENWNAELRTWLSPFLGKLGHKARRRMCPLYVAGLIGPGDRKSVQPMAERLAPGDYDQLHHFVGAGVWDATPLENELLIQADRLIGGNDAVLVIDDTAIPKKGKHSVGVASQYASALARTHKSACVGARLCQCPLHSETDPSAALPRIDAMCHFRTHALQQNIREGLSRGQFRVLACRVPFLQILRNQLPPQVACEIARPLLSSTAAGLPSSQVPDSSLLRRLLSFARWRLRGKLLPRSCLYLDPLCSFNTHSTGTSAGAPLFLIKNTRNFAGLVLLAFRS